MEICALIMAGGHGTRFWPWSGALLPKQFLPIAHPEKSLLQMTFERVSGLCGTERVLILTNREYQAVVRTQLKDLPPENVIGEPLLRDTAAAVGFGSAVAALRWPDAVQVVLPADHEISPDERFQAILCQAARHAREDGRLYTIGITPTRPTSAYGYLKRGERLDSPEGFARNRVAAFVEKPDVETAKTYVESGNYLWNAGMFVWRSDAVQEALKRRLPEHASRLPEAAKSEGAPDFENIVKEAFLAVPKISIDFGVMQAEGANGNVCMIEGDFQWSDLGGWQAFADTLPPDGHGNRIYGHGMDWDGETWKEFWIPREPRQGDKDEDLSLGDVLTMDARDNLVFNNRRGHRISLFGVRDLAVIHTHKETLVTSRDLAEEIKPLVSNLPETPAKGGLSAVEKVEKPWGWELWWGWTDDFAGKTLFLRKGKRFSLQYHVVKEEVIYVHQGRARLETAARGEELREIVMEPGQAVHVEPGRLHRIEALEDCLLFESSLPFLWDVVRIADDFGREGTREAEAPGRKS